MPRNPLQLEFCICTTSWVPGRRVELELTSFTASSIAILATLPMVESNVKMDPIFTTAGLEEAFLPFERTPKQSNNKERIENKLILTGINKLYIYISSPPLPWLLFSYASYPPRVCVCLHDFNPMKQDEKN